MRALAAMISLSGAIALVPSSPIAAQDAPVRESAPQSVVPEDGESAASAIQRAVVERHARWRALRERYGDAHLDVVAERAALTSLIASLRAELAQRGRVDRARVREWTRAQLAEVDMRLAELGVRCSSGHVDVRGANARRAALAEALASIERGGRFLPVIEEPPATATATTAALVPTAP